MNDDTDNFSITSSFGYDNLSQHGGVPATQKTRGRGGFAKRRVNNRHFMINHRAPLNEKPYKVYSTNFIGAKIYHAITGEHIGYVGRDDDQFFKVSMTTGVLPATIDAGYIRDPIHLYYYGPDEFEQHHKSVLPENVKEAWYYKMQRSLKRQ